MVHPNESGLDEGDVAATGDGRWVRLRELFLEEMESRGATITALSALMKDGDHDAVRRGLRVAVSRCDGGEQFCVADEVTTDAEAHICVLFREEIVFRGAAIVALSKRMEEGDLFAVRRGLAMATCRCDLGESPSYLAAALWSVHHERAVLVVNHEGDVVRWREDPRKNECPHEPCKAAPGHECRFGRIAGG